MYRLISFCDVNLEHYNQVESIGSGATPTAYLPLIDGGALDAFGGQQKAPGAVERVKSFRLRANTEAELSALYFGLMALRGKRGALARRMVNGDVHWQYARLVELVAQRNYEMTQFKVIQDVDLRFSTQEPTWRGLPGYWYLNTGFYFNDGQMLNDHPIFTLLLSTQTFTITLGSASDAGRAPVRAITITISAGDTELTTLSIARTGGEALTWAGSLAAGKSLVIDTGILRVMNNEVEAYSELTFAPTADMAAWFTLQPGPNEITVIRTGGGVDATITFEYYEAWY